jgi:transcriptional regulator with XRE-family HTH domain
MTDLGDRLQSVRKRTGVTQRELAVASGVSLSLIRKVEQGEHDAVRLETLRKLAIGLRVRTSVLQISGDAEGADVPTLDRWEPVRRALGGQVVAADEPATVEGVRAAFRAVEPMIEGHRYAELAASLPSLLRDVEDVADTEDGRTLRSRVLGSVGWLLVQNRQFDTAETTLDRAIEVAPDRATAAVAVNTKTWARLRQGRLAEARELAVKWADDIEPRFSRATTQQLAVWGELWLYVANAAVRDGAPNETGDALRLAAAAAHRIGGTVRYDASTQRLFGPMTVARITAECAIITDEPDKALAVAERIPPDRDAPNGAGNLRHKLDIANAHAKLGQFSDSMGQLAALRAQAPEWLVQQRYARDVVGGMVAKRRTLTADMRELADFVGVPY